MTHIDESWVAKAAALGPIIKEHAAEAERQRRLSKPVLEAMVKSGITNMFLPKSLGGPELDPLTCLRVVEEVAAVDAAAGWMLMVTNSGAWNAGRLPAPTVEEMFRHPENSIQATAFQPPVAAREVEGGYRLTGRTPFASGAHAARWFQLTGIVMEEGRPRMVNGMPQLVCAVLPAESLEIIDTWNGMGLRASDSSDLAVDDLFVPAAWTYALTPQFAPNRHYTSPLYKLPMIAAIVFAHIAPTATGIARSAVEAVRAQCARRVPMGSMVPLRDRGAAQYTLGRADGMLRSARALMFEAMSDAWERTLAGETLSLQKRADLLLAATHTVQTAVEVTDLMFGLGGSSAVIVGNPLEKLFRDANVIRQHGFVCAARYETCAQVTLGLEPDLPLVHF